MLARFNQCSNLAMNIWALVICLSLSTPFWWVCKIGQMSIDIMPRQTVFSAGKLPQNNALQCCVETGALCLSRDTGVLGWKTPQGEPRMTSQTELWATEAHNGGPLTCNARLPATRKNPKSFVWKGRLKGRGSLETSLNVLNFSNLFLKMWPDLCALTW